jgi:DNA primase
MTTGEKVRAGRVTVELSNTGKVLFPEDGITKGDLVAYYQAVAGEMLPPLRDRPVSMTRFPDGISKSRSPCNGSRHDRQAVAPRGPWPTAGRTWG